MEPVKVNYNYFTHYDLNYVNDVYEIYHKNNSLGFSFLFCLVHVYTTLWSEGVVTVMEVDSVFFSSTHSFTLTKNDLLIQ